MLITKNVYKSKNRIKSLKKIRILYQNENNYQRINNKNIITGYHSNLFNYKVNTATISLYLSRLK